jgi:hypothetical protein
MLLQGHDFLLAVDILANWLREYQRDQGRTKSGVESSCNRVSGTPLAQCKG